MNSSLPCSTFLAFTLNHLLSTPTPLLGNLRIGMSRRQLDVRPKRAGFCLVRHGVGPRLRRRNLRQRHRGALFSRRPFRRPAFRIPGGQIRATSCRHGVGSARRHRRRLHYLGAWIDILWNNQVCGRLPIFKMRPRISIRGFFRLSIGPSLVRHKVLILPN